MVDKRVMNITQAAGYIGVSRSVVETWLSKGMLPYEELPSCGSGSHRFRRIRVADIDEFLEKYYKQNKVNKDENKQIHKDIVLLPK
ncbi:helix-turn-helix domain-containing protein [Candidatus Latescibacterota bacterium]